MRGGIRLPASGYLFAILSLVLVVCLRWILDRWLGDRVPFVTLYAAVAGTVWFGGYRPAILCALLGYFACAYLFIGPRHQLHFDQPNIVALIAYLVSCTIIIGFGQAVRVAKLQVRKQLDLLRVTFASIGDAVITTDVEGRIMSMNGGASSLTGWSPAEATGRAVETVFRIIDEGTRESMANPVEQVLRTGRIVALGRDTLLIARDGTERPIDESAAPIFDDGGDIVGCVLVFRDVSERRRVERDLRRNEQELADFFENAMVGLHWVGPDGTIMRVNQTELNLLGYERDEYIGHNIRDFHVDADTIERILSSLAAGETLHDYPARMRCKDGSIKSVLISSNVLWEDGEFVHSRCFTRDVTDRKHLEETLLASEIVARQRLRELEAIYETTPVGMCLIDRDLRYVRINDRLAAMNGVPATEHIGKTIREMVPELADQVEGVFRRIMETGESILDVELTGQTRAQPGVTRTWLENWTPLRDHHGEIVGVNVTALEITDRKKAEAQLIENQAALRDADRRKDEFLAMLAHELRNPLAPIRNSLEILSRAASDPKLMHQSLTTMERQILRMERLIDDLLDVSRITHDRLELRREWVEIASVIRDAVESSRPLLEAARHDLIVRLPETPIRVDADPLRLSQVFINLLSNACKYTEPGGRIELSAQQEGNDVLISVKDDGIGIPPQMLPRIFDMFIQVDRSMERSQGGLGIGLTLVKQLVEMHDGSVDVTSDGPGQGSEFIVRLPILDEAPAEPQSPSFRSDLRDGPARRILVVDDNQDSAESLAMLLRLTGHDARSVFDGVAALREAEEFRPDVVLLDIGLPQLNGFDVCRRIRQQPWGKEIVMVALTGWGQDEDRRKSKLVGFDAHMVKPVDHLALFQLFNATPRGEV